MGMISVDLDAIGAAVLASRPSEVADMPDPESVVFDAAPHVVDAILSDDKTGASALPAPVELMSFDEFQVLYWQIGHTMLGALISKRVGEPVDLVGQAMSQEGLEACKAMFELINSNPMTAKLVLSKSGGLLMQIGPIIAHGMACYAIVKMAGAQTIEPEKEDAE